MDVLPSDYAPITAAWLVAEGLDADRADRLARLIKSVNAQADPRDRWAIVSQQGLLPSDPAIVHEQIFRYIYRDWPASRGPAPAWIPPADIRRRANLGRLLDRLGFEAEQDFRDWAIADRAEFWRVMAETLGIRFDEPWHAVDDLTHGFERPRWFPGGRLNITSSCFAPSPDAIAVVEQGEDGMVRRLTYGELERQADRFAAGLVAAGLVPGESVGLLLPLTTEAVIALLGVIRAGCVAVGIPESFATPEIALRLRLGKARWVVTQDQVVRRGVALPLLARLDPIDGLRRIVVPTAGESFRPGPRDVVWSNILAHIDVFNAVSVAPESHAIVLFSSGTTGEPKAIPWTHTTPMKCAADGFLYLDIQPGDVVAWPSSTGWMMGPWLVFASLVNGATIALYDGHPGTEGFCRFVQDRRVTILGLVPSLVAAWRAGGWPARLDWTRIKAFGSTGECARADDMLALMSWAGYRPVIEYCGGTEIGGGYITSTMLRPNAPGCFTTVAFGLELEVRDASGATADRGEAFLIGPSVGLSTELLNRDHHATYFAGTPPHDPPLRRHGDAVERLPEGYFRVLGRVDDTMNLGGIKVSAIEIEQALGRHPAVREVAAVAVNDGQGGPDRLIAHVVAGRPIAVAAAFRKELQMLLNEHLNPLFRLSEVVLVDQLPRTASNKVLRRLLRQPGDVT